MNKINITTYIYQRNDGVCVHVNAGHGFIGKEYEHPNEPNWKPPENWPYVIIDNR